MPEQQNKRAVPNGTFWPRFRGGKLPQFIEFTVIWQRRLRHDAEQLSRVDDRCAVIEFSAEAQRKPDCRDWVKALRRLHNLRQRRFDRAEQAVREKQIAAGVAGEAEFREHGQLDPARGGCLHVGKDLLGVIGAVRHPQGGGEGGCL